MLKRSSVHFFIRIVKFIRKYCNFSDIVRLWYLYQKYRNCYWNPSLIICVHFSRHWIESRLTQIREEKSCRVDVSRTAVSAVAKRKRHCSGIADTRRVRISPAKCFSRICKNPFFTIFLYFQMYSTLTEARKLSSNLRKSHKYI